MNSQEELRQLELDFSTGQISEADYHQRRDELISLGATGPQSARYGNNPFAPPAHWQGPYSGPQDPTRPSGYPADYGTGPTGQGYVDPNVHTQMVHSPGTGSFPQQPYSGLGPAGWSAVTGPTTGQPDPFRGAARKKRSRKELIRAGLAMVLLAAVIIGVAYWVGTGHLTGNNQAAQSSQQSATQPSDPGASGDPLLTDLPGEPQVAVTSKVKTWTDVPSVGLLSAAETMNYQSGEPTDADLAMAKNGYTTISVLVIKEKDATTATKVRDQLGGTQTAPTERRVQAQGGILAFANDSASDGPAKVFRVAYYASNGYLVRIGATGTDLFAVEQQFQVVLTAQLRLLHADS